MVQDGKTFGFVQDDYSFAAPIQGQQVAGLFALPANSGFDPLKPWRLEILVNGAGTPPVTVAFGLDYKIPDAYVLQVPVPPRRPRAAAAAARRRNRSRSRSRSRSWSRSWSCCRPSPAWVEAWSDARVNIAILAVLLSVLTLIFIFQATLARSRVAHRLVRTGFLLVVLVWLGWTAGVQLSIVNVMNYVRAPFNHVDIGFYLAEPLMVIIAGYTLVSVVLIGRGVFCGWLCPFGALQELLGQLSRALRVPQWNPPVALEKRLWMGKYIAAAAVLVLVMTQIDPAGATVGDRAVQDGDHHEIHARLALCALCRRIAGHRAVLGAGLLPLPVSTGRRARIPRSAAPAQSAQASSRMRQSLPLVRTRVSGAGDRADGQDRHGRVLPVPRLPGRILRRQAMSAAGAGRQAARRGKACRRHGENA